MIPAASNNDFKDVPDAAAIVEAVERLSLAEHSTVSDPLDKDSAGVPELPYVILPTGKSAISLKPIIDSWRTKPERRRGTAKLTTLDSFIDHVQRFESASTVVFCNKSQDKPRLVAVYDYNPPGADNTDAAFHEHRSVYPFPLSEEWLTWRKKDGVEMSQSDFARFIDARLPDVYAVEDGEETQEMIDYATMFGGRYASRSRLLDVSRSLELTSSVGMKHFVRLDTGETKLSFEETHSGAGGTALEVPNLFVLLIPVFDDGAAYRIICRLRYRRAGSAVAWSYQMVDPTRYFDDAIKGAVEKVEADTKSAVFYGTRERVVPAGTEDE